MKTFKLLNGISEVYGYTFVTVNCSISHVRNSESKSIFLLHGKYWSAQKLSTPEVTMTKFLVLIALFIQYSLPAFANQTTQLSDEEKLLTIREIKAEYSELDKDQRAEFAKSIFVDFLFQQEDGYIYKRDIKFIEDSLERGAVTDQTFDKSWDQLDRKEKKFIRLLGKGRVLSRANIRDNSGEIISGTIIAIMATLVIISAKHTNLNGIGFDFSGTNTF